MRWIQKNDDRITDTSLNGQKSYWSNDPHYGWRTVQNENIECMHMYNYFVSTFMMIKHKFIVSIWLPKPTEHTLTTLYRKKYDVLYKNISSVLCNSYFQSLSP